MVSLGKRRRTFFGLSTDTKPVAGVGNGDAFIEMDTGDSYFFDVENMTWWKIGGEIGAAVVGTAIVGTAIAG